MRRRWYKDCRILSREDCKPSPLVLPRPWSCAVVSAGRIVPFTPTTRQPEKKFAMAEKGPSVPDPAHPQNDTRGSRSTCALAGAATAGSSSLISYPNPTPLIITMPVSSCCPIAAARVLSPLNTTARIIPRTLLASCTASMSDRNLCTVHTGPKSSISATSSTSTPVTSVGAINNPPSAAQLHVTGGVSPSVSWSLTMTVYSGNS
mmetsp:Transcript_15331/g.36191  ORF Transcript_15331/g.36191 Transcript_15331/m.36191 type:complete len:205 (+) Transcript_15331:80-694(+)